MPYRCINFAYLGISGSLQGLEVVQQLLLYRRIGGHTEGELPLRSNGATEALDNPAPNRVQAFEGLRGESGIDHGILSSGSAYHAPD